MTGPRHSGRSGRHADGRSVAVFRLDCTNSGHNLEELEEKVLSDYLSLFDVKEFTLVVALIAAF